MFEERIPQITSLPHGFMATNLGQFGIALFTWAGWNPGQQSWVLLDKDDPNKWQEQVHMKFLMLFPQAEEEILSALKDKLPLPECQYHGSFKYGKTIISLIPSPNQTNEVYVFDHRRNIWLPFNWETQWENLKEYGLNCKAITIQRQADKAFKWIELYFKHDD
jgi:hypothetical protein